MSLELEAAIAELLRVAEPPLRFLARADAKRLTAIPQARIGELAERALALASGGARDALSRLGSLVRDLALGDPERCGEQVRGALEEIDWLRSHLAPLGRDRREAASEGEATTVSPPHPPLRGDFSPKGEVGRYRRSAENTAADLEHLRTSVQFLKGVGPRRAEQLARLGLETLEDVLYHLPFRYEDRRLQLPIARLRPGEEATCVGEVLAVGEGRAGRTRRRLLEARIGDGGAMLTLTWFHQVGWFAGKLKVGTRLRVHGRVEARFGRMQIIHPEIEMLEADEEGAGPAAILPVYEKPTEMSVRAMRGIVAAAREAATGRISSALPEAAAARLGLLDLESALAAVHEPPPDADVEALGEGISPGHRSIAFDELFYLQLGMRLRKDAAKAEPGIAFAPKGALAAHLRERLGFRLTGAQERVLAEIARDMAEPKPMSRLVQGDVGSGKTVVAALAACAAVECGYQVAFMAPTEILAEQHARNLVRWLDPLGVRSALLTGRITGRERRERLADLESGEIALVTGTHALIQEGVAFRRLGLAIVDEQHRFGVLQRRRLAGLGDNPDVLLMTATPIPRTLAMAIYGDIDLSFLDELPPGRQPIATKVVREREREGTYERIRGEVEAGRQVYAVFPLVEDGEESDLRSAKRMAEELAAGPFRGLRVALLHGQMKGDEKDAIMRRFQSGDQQILVATTVIEVGVDVPNATVMIIDHAEQFGLAQLHQLRGRVGRGAARSYCYLISTGRAGREGYERLKLLERESSGARIAEADLELRGSGQLFGVRQSGLPDFRVANLVRDAALLAEARREVDALLARDPTLDGEGCRGIREILEHRWRGRLGLARVG